MTTPNIQQNETEAILKGGMAGGGYLDQIGKTDLATLTKEEFTEFCGHVFRGTCEELLRQANDDVPW